MIPNILSAVRDAIWCITHDKLCEIVGFLDSRSRGIQIDSASVAAMAADSRSRRETSVSRSVAVLPIVGTITQRAGLIEEASGLASTDAIGRELRRLVADETIGAIVLDIDSPGGTSYGVQELAAEIYAARAAKPIVAVANSYAASAAYWIGTAAGELSVTPGGQVGSVGAYILHWDESQANEMLGIKPTYISSSAEKIEGNPDSPLTPEAASYLQQRVNEVADRFRRDVAKFRGVTPARVRAEFGEGRVFSADEAVRRGMADRVETLGDAIARLAGTRKPQGKKTAAARAQLDMERGR